MGRELFTIRPEYEHSSKESEKREMRRELFTSGKENYRSRKLINKRSEHAREVCNTEFSGLWLSGLRNNFKIPIKTLINNNPPDKKYLNNNQNKKQSFQLCNKHLPHKKENNNIKI